MLMDARRRATKIASERPPHMLRSTPLRPQLLSIFALCIALLGVVPPRAAQMATTSQAVVANPTALSVSVPLGQRLTASITLTNTTNAPVTPTVYEAWPARGAQAQASQSTGPARVALPRQAARVDPQLLADFQHA